MFGAMLSCDMGGEKRLTLVSLVGKGLEYSRSETKVFGNMFVYSKKGVYIRGL